MSKNNELWKSCEPLGFSRYRVSNLGRVHNTFTNRYLTGFDNGKGYIQITMTNDEGQIKAVRRGRLVALLFVDNPNPDVKNEVDHIDTIRSNDVASNLRWVTKYENMNNPKTRINISNSLTGRHRYRDENGKIYYK